MANSFKKIAQARLDLDLKYVHSNRILNTESKN